MSTVGARRARRYSSFVPTWQTLSGWADQLNVKLADLEGPKWEDAVAVAFPLPRHSRVMQIMQDKLAQFKEGTLAPDHSIKQVIHVAFSA